MIPTISEDVIMLCRTVFFVGVFLTSAAAASAEPIRLRVVGNGGVGFSHDGAALLASASFVNEFDLDEGTSINVPLVIWKLVADDRPLLALPPANPQLPSDFLIYNARTGAELAHLYVPVLFQISRASSGETNLLIPSLTQGMQTLTDGSVLRLTFAEQLLFSGFPPDGNTGEVPLYGSLSLTPKAVPAPVPEPTTLVLVGSGIVVGLCRKIGRGRRSG
jgi:hypothetical protein